MCGFYFYNKKTPKQFQDLSTGLKLRGPENFTHVTNSFGTFAHSLLNTIGERTLQPIDNSHGYLLYNGSTYNSLDSNDSQWIARSLDNNYNHNLQLIKSLTGEYALCYVTKKNIIFCTDQWGTKNLWYFYDKTSKQLAVSSDRYLIVKLYGAAWLAEDNKVYVIDKTDFSIKKLTNTVWNFDQKINHYDYVFESFEKAIINRHRNNLTTYLLSSGYDSGVICCCAQKIFGNIDSVTIGKNENKKVLADRMQKHKSHILQLCSDSINDDIKSINKFYPFDFVKSSSAKSFTHIIKNHVIPNSKKIIISGVGGDELFSDYSHPDEIGRFGKTQGNWPTDLKLLYPWHNHMETNLAKQLLRNDFIAGYFGKEIRTPLLDQNLFQNWLNVKNNLKNKSYKDWMKKYMEIHDYPYSDEKIGFDAN